MSDAELIAAVHVASWRDAYSGLMPKEFLDGLDITRRVSSAWGSGGQHRCETNSRLMRDAVV